MVDPIVICGGVGVPELAHRFRLSGFCTEPGERPWVIEAQGMRKIKETVQEFPRAFYIYGSEKFHDRLAYRLLPAPYGEIKLPSYFVWKGPSAQPIIVVGPGRCGSSTMARRLILAGVHMGERFVPGDEKNPKGYWEDIEFAELTKNWKTSWITNKEWADRFLSLCRIRAEKGIPWGWKDARISLVIEHVVQLFPKAIYIRCRRPPSQTIVSVQQTYGWSASGSKAFVMSREAKLTRFTPWPTIDVWIENPLHDRRGWD